MDTQSTCRYCKKYGNSERMVKYGVRHYAHFSCFLDAGRKLTELHPWQVGKFPAILLRDRGLSEEAERISGKPAHVPVRPNDRSKPF